MSFQAASDPHRMHGVDGATPDPSFAEQSTERVAWGALPAGIPGKPAHPRVAVDVVAQIAARAAAGVSGVHKLTGTWPNDPVLQFFQRLLHPRASHILGVRIKGSGQVVEIDLTLTVEYGARIPAVVEAVQTAVTTHVETLTGVSVRAVRVEVIALHVSDGDGAVALDPPPGDHTRHAT